MLGISDVVLFGIQSGLKLAQQGRQAYIEGAIAKALVLPLPNFNSTFSRSSANQYFRTRSGKAQLEQNPSLKDIFERLRNRQEVSEVEEELYINAAIDFRLLDDIESNTISRNELANAGLTANALQSLVTVRQFANKHNKTFPTVIQRILGSLIEVGIDAFSQFPTILDKESAAGGAVAGFLDSIEDLDFASGNVEVLARSLFISAVETIGQNSDLLGADEKIQTLIQSVSSGIIQDLTARIDQLGNNLVEREQVLRWGNLVLRSVLSNIRESVLLSPKSLGIDDPAQQALLSSVATSILGAILDEEQVNLRRLFSRQALDQVIKASLSTVAEFPELLGNNGEGVQKIISQVAQGLAHNEHILGKDMLPETVRLVIEKTAHNAEFLWPAGFSDPDKHLLVTAAVEFLNQFSSIPRAGQTWRPAFSKTLFTGLLDVILEETLQNPIWVSKLGINDTTILGQATRIALNVLQDVPADRLSIETGAEILRAVIQAVSKRLDFLDIIEIAGEKKPAIFAASKAIIGAVLSDNLDPKVLWTLARGEAFSAIMNTALDVLAKVGINQETIDSVLSVLENAKQAILAGGRWILEEVLEEIKDIAAVPAI